MDNKQFFVTSPAIQPRFLIYSKLILIPRDNAWSSLHCLPNFYLLQLRWNQICLPQDSCREHVSFFSIETLKVLRTSHSPCVGFKSSCTLRNRIRLITHSEGHDIQVSKVHPVTDSMITVSGCRTLSLELLPQDRPRVHLVSPQLP